jgi:pimeloyl-ACP methyl ester carboxylesterase
VTSGELPAGVRGRLLIAGGKVEVEVIGAGGPRLADSPLVLLHEGLGCIALWRDFPHRLAALTGRTVVVWSRHGYGGSAVVTEPRSDRYMHHEALDVLPALLAVMQIRRPVLVGHSDGASIALIHAGAGHPVAAVVALAPHVVVEARSIEGIEAARNDFLDTDLSSRLGQYHTDPEATFWGWNNIWLSPEFRAWNIEEYLPGISCPVLLVQCADDRYGTLDQLDRIARQVTGVTERLVLPEGGHSPHQADPALVAERIAAFVADAN